MNCSYMFYKHPADINPRNHEAWNEALPIGNGRLGGMVFGGIEAERIQLNEDTLWYGGGNRNRVNPDARRYLAPIRELLKQGEIKKAQRLGKLSMIAGPEGERNYTTAGDLTIDFEIDGKEARNYKRSLDLNKAIAFTQYDINNVTYEREAFCSVDQGLMVLHIKINEPGQLHFILGLSRSKCLDENKAIAQDTIIMSGIEGGHGVSFCVGVTVNITDGTIETIGNRIVVEDAMEATIYVAIRTSYYGDDPVMWCKETLAKGRNIPYEKIKEEHIKEYQSFYQRALLTMKPENDSIHQMPTDERLQRVKEGNVDSELIATYFNFGRYLLISCSRPGTQAANLQGIWNKDFNPPWDSKYTININTEMNYWPAESCNLSDCHLPLFELLKKMLPNGQRVAKEMYGCRGFVAHHNTDLWGDCAPQDIYMPATIWPMGAAWLCTHIWTHYEYTLDMDFLKEYYPIMKEAALFFVDYMFENEEGQLITGPSVSPENTYIHPSKEQGTLCLGPSMDSQIIRDLFQGCIKAANLLQCRDEIITQLEDMLPKLPKPSIGKYGQIMEWSQDYEEVHLGHRHISHLYALYPSNQINYDNDLELIKAARITLERRLANGGGHTGWSRAWIIAMWARLRDQEKAGENVQAILAKSTSINLFDMHPPFQIDGNFGTTAAIAEMLVQSDGEVIYLLPCLPEEWVEGRVYGLKVKKDIELSFSWKNGKLTELMLTSYHGENCVIKVPNMLQLATNITNCKMNTIEYGYQIFGNQTEYCIHFY